MGKCPFGCVVPAGETYCSDHGAPIEPNGDDHGNVACPQCKRPTAPGFCTWCGARTDEILINCAKCGAETPDGPVCARCGKDPHEQLIVCKQCGAETPDRSVCVSCGKDPHVGGRSLRAELRVVGGRSLSPIPIEGPCAISLGRPDRSIGFVPDIDFAKLLGEDEAVKSGIGHQHAFIEADGQGNWTIIHGGANNPVIVDGKNALFRKEESQTLRNGSSIRLGKVEMEFLLLS